MKNSNQQPTAHDCDAKLHNANLLGANFDEANLWGSDLTDCQHLQISQRVGSCIWGDTIFPDYLIDTDEEVGLLQAIMEQAGSF